MNRNPWNSLVAAGALALAITTLPAAHAQCGLPSKPIRPAALQQRGLGSLHLLRVALPGADEYEAPTIVGMWHVTFIAKTMNGNAIPATEIDNALIVWHKDGTEIMNSGRPPQDGNFCMGVWERTGPRGYKLNHFAWVPNNYAPGTAEGVIGQPIGPTHIQEDVEVGPEGKHYSGQFSLDQYDTTGRVIVSFTGILKATRITLDTKVGDLL